MSQQEVSDTLTRLEYRLDKESKAYGILTIVLSALDVLTGMLCIIFTSIQITAFVMSILSGTVVCSRAVQVLKAKNLLNTIRILNGISGGYVVCRMKKGEYMKNFVKAIKNNPLTLLFAIIGALVMGFCGYQVSASLLGVPVYACVLIGVAAALLTVLAVFVLGWDKVKEAILRAAKKTLSKENYDKLVETAGALEQKQAEEAQKKADEEARQKKLAEARATVEAYDQAKKLLDEDAASKASSDATPTV